MVHQLNVFVMKVRAALLGIFLSKVERNYLRRCKNRPTLSDDEFIAAYYSACPFSPDIPLRVRRVFREQLRYSKVIPTDVVWEMSDNFPLEDFMLEVAEEFNIDTSVSAIKQLDGSFDSIVQLVTRSLGGR